MPRKMPAKRIRGPFSDFFYDRLRKAKIKPRRITNPKGIGAFTWAVPAIRKQWTGDLYYDPRALQNLNHAVRLVPWLGPKLREFFEYDLHHELVHTGQTPHTKHTAAKIQRIAHKTGKTRKAFVIAEQVANRGVMQKILQETGAKSFRSVKARTRLKEVLTWDIIAFFLRRGNLKRAMKAGTYKVPESDKSAMSGAIGNLRNMYPGVPESVISDAIGLFVLTYGRIIADAFKAQKPRKRAQKK